MKKPKGDCYEASGRYMLDNGNVAYKVFALAHGMVDGTGPVLGKRFGHAWIEAGDFCIEVANGERLLIPKALYYAIGNIGDVTFYDYDQTVKALLKHKHWGPWE